MVVAAGGTDIEETREARKSAWDAAVPGVAEGRADVVGFVVPAVVVVVVAGLEDPGIIR